jgi:hypothetical protein
MIAAICGVLCSLIFGFPAALIGRNYSKKATGLWAGGDVQAAVRASRAARGWLIASTVLDVIGLVAAVALIVANSQPNFSTPSVVAASIKTQLQQRISSPSSQYYEPGVSVTSVVCTPSGSNTDRCVVTFSDGSTLTQTAVISGNGTGYTAH